MAATLHVYNHFFSSDKIGKPCTEAIHNFGKESESRFQNQCKKLEIKACARLLSLVEGEKVQTKLVKCILNLDQFVN